MKFYDYWAETLHEKFPKLKNLLCWLGLHSWGYMGEINCWPAGYRNLWDVGVDTNNMYPYSWEEVTEKLSKIPIGCIHHETS